MTANERAPVSGDTLPGDGSSRAERVAKAIADQARSMEPGSRLGTKEAVRAKCKVSVGTFNEGLRLAHSRGVVDVRPGPGGGLFVAQPSPMVRLGNAVLALDSTGQDVAYALRMRNALESLVIDDAVRFASGRDRRRLGSLLKPMRNAVDEDDPLAYLQANWALHAAIAEISPSPILRSVYLALLDVIQNHTVAVISEGPGTIGQMADRLKLHEELVDAIVNRDADRAAELAGRHSIESA
ncbi:FadR/GntR family transcriptional regulator [Amycolatopsis sp. NPDC003676]